MSGRDGRRGARSRRRRRCARRRNATEANAGWSALRMARDRRATGVGVLDAASEAAPRHACHRAPRGGAPRRTVVGTREGGARTRRAVVERRRGRRGDDRAAATPAVPAELLDELTCATRSTAASCTVAAGAGVAGMLLGINRRLLHRYEHKAMALRSPTRRRASATRTTGPSSATPTSARRSSRPRPGTGTTSTASSRDTTSSSGRSSDATRAYFDADAVLDNAHALLPTHRARWRLGLGASIEVLEGERDLIRRQRARDGNRAAARAGGDQRTRLPPVRT